VGEGAGEWEVVGAAGVVAGFWHRASEGVGLLQVVVFEGDAIALGAEIEDWLWDGGFWGILGSEGVEPVGRGAPGLGAAGLGAAAGLGRGRGKRGTPMRSVLFTVL
jgi:hypothetical protein